MKPIVQPSFFNCFSFCMLLLWGVIGHLSAQAQTPFSCGTDDYTQRLMETDSAYRNFVQNAKAVHSTDKAANDAILTIPVVFVVYNLGEPVGQGSNVPESVLQEQIHILNRFFKAGSSAFAENGATDSRIRFVMARRGPDCTPFNGVVRVDGRAVPNYESVGVDYLDSYKQTQLRNLAGDAVNEMGQQAIIVRVYWQLSGAGGWAGFGREITVGAQTMRGNYVYNRTLAHEMGHVLFLPHTFQGGDDVNCPPNTDPATQGDQVADTDPHLKSQPTNACSPASETLINGCTGLPFGKIGRNIMSYGCNSYIFTPGQIARMRSYLTGSLSRFVNSPYALPPMTEQSVRAAACTPTSGISSTVTTYHSEGIARLQLASSNSNTNYGGNSPLLTIDLSCSQQTVLRAGQSYTLTIDAPYNNQHRRVYIDWNNDGAFDELNERAFSTQIGEETGTITVPANAVTTQALRMRVVVCDGPTLPTACLIPTAGAAQDFGVRIEPATTAAQLRVGQMNSLSYCSGQSIVLPYTLSGGADIRTELVRAELSDANGSFASPTLLATGTGGLITSELPTTLLTSLAYRIRLVPANAAIVSDQTPMLSVRQSATGTLLGPPITNEGQTVSLTLALTGEGPWRVEYLTTTRTQQYPSSLDVTASPTLLTTTADAYKTMQILLAENGCGAISTGAAVTINPGCSPPENLTETVYAWGMANLNWQALSNRSYVVQWKQQPASDWTTLPVQPWLGTSLTGLVLGTTYEWRVAATCANSLSSAFSPTRAFSFSCLMPDGLAETITQSSATLRWNTRTNTSYSVRWRPAETANWTTASVISGQYAVPGVMPGQAYEWQISSVCSNSSSSVFTPVRSFTVACSPPIHLFAFNITASSASVGWTSFTGQQCRVRWRVVSSANWTTLNWITTNSQALTDLPGGQQIEWQLQARCSDGSESSFANGSLINTLCLASSAPIISDIAATSALVQLAPADAKNFTVWSRKAGTTTWNQYYILNDGRTSYPLLYLQHNTAYEVALSVACMNGLGSGQSASASFTTVNCAPPAVVSFSGPQTVLSGQSTTLVATLTGQSPWSVLLTTGESFTGLTTSPVNLVSTLYNPYWGSKQENISVARISNACQSIKWSGPYISVWVVAACGEAPSNLRVDQQGTNAVYLAWDAASNVYSYTVQWRQAGTTTWNTLDNAYSNIYLNNLTYGQAYEWRVQGICTQSQSIISSAIQSFTMNCPMPKAMTEVYSPNAARLSWAWQASAGVSVNYTLRWRMTGNTAWTTLPNLVSNVHTLTGLTPNTAYEWQLQTNCPAGAIGLESPVRSFTTGCGIPQMSYISNITSSSATANWINPFPDVQYTLCWRLGTPTSWTINPTTYTGAAGAVTGLLIGQYYNVQVQAFCANGQRSPFSESLGIYTNCAPPTATFTGSRTIAPNQTATLTATLTGDSPWSLTLNTGQIFTTISSSPFAFTVAPTATTIYSVVAVGNPCGTGTASGSAVVTVQVPNICTPPTNLTETEMTTTNIRLGWQAVSGATSYTIQYRETGTTAWTIATPVASSTAWTVAVLMGKTYEWQIQAMCADGQVSGFSSLRTFIMTCPIPIGQTEVLAPTTANLQWRFMSVNAVSLTYNIQWRPVGSPNWTTVNNASSSAYSLTGLSAGQTYEWQIQTICPDGSTTAYTIPRSFTTGCYAPVFQSDFNRTSTSTTLQWQFISGVTYAMRWRPTNSTNWTLVPGLTSTTYALTGLTNATTYEFQVQSVCSTSESSGFSGSYTFTTVCMAPSFININAISIDRATLSWTNLGAGVRYNFVWGVAGSPISTTVASLTTSTYSLTGLTNGVAYEFQVQTICTDGNLSGLSPIRSFTTGCNAPSSSGISWGATVINPSWTDFGPATRYNLQWRQVGTATWNTVSSLSTASYSLTGLAPQTAYEFQVQTICPDGSTSAYTTSRTVITTACQIPLSPSESNIQATSVRLNWGWYSNTTQTLQWRAVGTINWTIVPSLTGSYNLTGLTMGTAYEWQVRTDCSPTSSSSFTAPRSFTPTCSAVTNLSEYVITPTILGLQWNTVSGVLYTLQIRPATTSIWTSYTNTGSSRYLNSLIPGTTYEWQVIATCPGGTTTASASRTVITQCTTPISRSTNGITSTGAYISWNGDSNLGYGVQYRVMGSSTWTESPVVASTAYSITGLTNGTTYEWQVKMICSGVSTAYSPSLTFTTGCNAPTYNFTSFTSDKTASVYWQPFPTGTRFEVEYRAAGSVAVPLSFTTLARDMVLSGLTPSTAYEYRVRVLCDGGSPSAFTNYSSFTTQAPCSLMYSLRNGNWDDSAVWSCNRIPTSNDLVEVRHVITLPNDVIGNARQIRYTNGGRIFQFFRAKLRLGF